jgi:hypothetical protein
MVGAYQYNSTDGQAVILTAAISATTAMKAIGVSTEAVADAASVDVTIAGGTNTSQSGLTIGSGYYIDSVGALTTTITPFPKIGVATSASDLLVTDMTENPAEKVISTTFLNETANFVDFIFTGEFDCYLIRGKGILHNSDNVDDYLLTSSDGGDNFDTGGSDYYWGRDKAIASAISYEGGASVAFINIVDGSGNEAQEGFDYTLTFHRPLDAIDTKVSVQWWASTNSGYNVSGTGMGIRNEAEICDAVRVKPASSSYGKGNWELVGIGSRV